MEDQKVDNKIRNAVLIGKIKGVVFVIAVCTVMYSLGILTMFSATHARQEWGAAKEEKSAHEPEEPVLTADEWEEVSTTRDFDTGLTVIVYRHVPTDTMWCVYVGSNMVQMMNSGGYPVTYKSYLNGYGK